MNCALVQLMRHLYQTNNAFVTLNPMRIYRFECNETNKSFYSFFFSFFLHLRGSFSRSKGIFFVNTNKEPPYAKGILPEFTLSDNGTETTTVGDVES